MNQQIELGSIITGALFLLSVATFFVGRFTATKTEGEKQGVLATDLKYIKEAVERIEKNSTSETTRLNGRIDEISLQLCAIAGTASAGKESAVMVHNRLNEHLEREHGMLIEKRPNVI